MVAEHVTVNQWVRSGFTGFSRTISGLFIEDRSFLVLSIFVAFPPFPFLIGMAFPCKIYRADGIES